MSKLSHLRELSGVGQYSTGISRGVFPSTRGEPRPTLTGSGAMGASSVIIPGTRGEVGAIIRQGKSQSR